MAKKKTEVESTEVVEEVKEVEAAEEVVEAAPKKTTKKSTKKKIEEPKEEAVAEEVKPEPEVEVEVVGTYAVEVKKEVEVKPESKEASTFNIEVVSPSGIFTFKKPELGQPKGKVYPRGSKLTVSEVKGNWAKVGEDKWIILSGSVVKI